MIFFKEQGMQARFMELLFPGFTARCERAARAGKVRAQHLLGITNGLPESGGGGADTCADGASAAPDAPAAQDDDDDDGGDDEDGPCRASPPHHTPHPANGLAPIPSATTRKPAAKPAPSYPPLESVTLPSVPTEQAAHYLHLRPQTMRKWACLDNGPIRPRRINGRLHWPVAEIRALLGVSE